MHRQVSSTDLRAASKNKRIPKPVDLERETEYILFAKQIDNNKMTDIAALLKTNTSLTSLGFRGWVEDAGARAIANALGENKTLEKLSFDSTRVSYIGVKALARALSTVCNLTHLSLMYLPLQDNSGEMLVKAVALPTCRLIVLRLDCCPDITNATGIPMLQTLIKNSTSRLQVVGLKDTAVDESIQREITLLLLPGGRPFEKKIPLSCAMGAYLTASRGASKSELDKLHGFAERIGPLTSANAVKVKPLPPSKETVSGGVNVYAKYAYTKKNNNSSKTRGWTDLLKEDDEGADAERERAIDMAHAKRQLRPILVAASTTTTTTNNNNNNNNNGSNKNNGRKGGAATVSNIKMLLRYNSTLAKSVK